MKAALRFLVPLGTAATLAAAPAPGVVPGPGVIGVQATDTVVIRGRPQTVHLYGSRGFGDPVIVSSGDGGWIHLGPHVAAALAAKGFFVVGFDTKAYLESFTSASTTVRLEDVPDDYRTLADYAAAPPDQRFQSRPSRPKPILIGVSEGAGLSALAATDPKTRLVISGVIALGLPKVNELGWRWKDSLIYVTHQVPNEPTFTSASVVGRLESMPFAVIQSTGDEFVSVPEIRNLLESAQEPKALWIVKAADHRFSGNLVEFHQRLLEAIDWVRQHQPR
jgi:alpha-beta hydrolase superfamily lysophospholipase